MSTTPSSIPTPRYLFGDVILVRFPFTNQTGSKQRPAVVVSSRDYNLLRPDVIMMAVTSQLKATATLGEVWLTEWQIANLLKPSAIKPVFATIEQTLIVRKLGVLHPDDLSLLRLAIGEILQ